MSFRITKSTSLSNQAGDTIVEVLLALTVLGLILGGSAVLVNKNSRSLQSTQEHSAGQRVAQSQLEHVRAYAASAAGKAAIKSGGGDLYDSAGFCLANVGTATAPRWEPKAASPTEPACSVDAAGKPTTEEPMYKIFGTVTKNDAKLSYDIKIKVSWLKLGGDTDQLELTYRTYDKLTPNVASTLLCPTGQVGTIPNCVDEFCGPTQTGIPGVGLGCIDIPPPPVPVVALTANNQPTTLLTTDTKGITLSWSVSSAVPVSCTGSSTPAIGTSAWPSSVQSSPLSGSRDVSSDLSYFTSNLVTYTLRCSATNAGGTVSDSKTVSVYKATPFYRAWSAIYTDHFYTPSSTEIAAATNGGGFMGQGQAGYISPVAVPGWGLSPLYRLYGAMPTGDHFYTTSLAEKNATIANYGYADEGITGYVLLPDAAGSCTASGTTPLYHLASTALSDNFYTTDFAGEYAPSIDRLAGLGTYGQAGVTACMFT